MDFYLKAMKQYADFNGRARRKEYWMFTLFYVIAIVVASIIDGIIGYPIVAGIAVLAHIIPGLAVGVRRMHDLDKSGWMLLVSIIPIVGGIWLFVLTVLDGTPGDNQYGPNPKA